MAVRNTGLKIHSPLGSGIPKVEHRNMKVTSNFLNFREEKQVVYSKVTRGI
jgi:hypothetical protein